MILQPQESTSAYAKNSQLQELSSLVIKIWELAWQCQKHNYDKYKHTEIVWVHAHPLSKVEKCFAVKLATKWQGPYWVAQQVGPVNYKVVLIEESD